MKDPKHPTYSLTGLFGNDESACELPIKLVQAVFESAYLLGRKDTIDGLYIDPNLAYEQFKQGQLDQVNALLVVPGCCDALVH